MSPYLIPYETFAILCKRGISFHIKPNKKVMIDIWEDVGILYFSVSQTKCHGTFLFGPWCSDVHRWFMMKIRTTQVAGAVRVNC